jgi:hypothetical protein
MLKGSLVEQYSKEAPRISFLTYFARSTLPAQELKARLKLVLFLQASTLYDLVGLSAELRRHDVLKVEGAILAAKVCRTELPLLQCSFPTFSPDTTEQ